LFDGFEPFENANGTFGVLGRCGGLLGSHGRAL
jgi:hypothetical protein